MFTTVLGAVLLLAPFILVPLFDDRFRGFVCVLIFETAFHFLLSIIAQAFHVFTYPVIASAYFVLALCSVAAFLWKGKPFKVKASSLGIITFLVILFELWTVHFNYTGVVATIHGIDSVVESSYSYPMFSDEWVASGFIGDSLRTASLPLSNFLDSGRPIANILAPFHSFLAGFFLLLGLDPVSDFAVASVASGFSLCLAFFVFLRSLRVTVPVSFLAVMFLPLITQGGNLPGIWFLLPYVVSLSVFLVTLAAMFLGSNAPSMVGAFLAMALYPPASVFVLPALVGRYVFGTAFPFRRFLLVFGIAVGSGLLILAVLSGIGAHDVLPRVANGFFHANLDGGAIGYSVLKVLPFWILPLSLVGGWLLWKKRALAALLPVIAGISFWVFYAFYRDIVIIERARVVMVTSILLVALAGIGVDFLWDRAREMGLAQKGFLRAFLPSLVFCLFFASASHYPASNAWDAFDTFVSSGPNAGAYPTPAPINRHLTTDDLRLFSGIKGERFIAPPWKGLVIGVATGNYPLESKTSTIATKILSYREFMAADCAQKTVLAEDHGVGYVYSTKMVCPHFRLVGESGELLSLYRFVI